MAFNAVCDEEIKVGECVKCEEDVYASDEYSNLCSYCNHMAHKDD